MAKAATKKEEVKKKPGTALTKPSQSALVSMKDAIKAEITTVAESTGAPSGDEIRVTQNKTFALPDGNETGGPINMIIVDYVTGRAYYDRPFDRANPSPPACASLSRNPTGMIPIKGVPDKQSDACTGCPMNEWESAASGKGKACKEMRILAVLPEDADETTPLSILKVSPTGLKAFDSYVRSLASSLEAAPFQVITEVSFDPNAEYSSIRFGKPTVASEELQALAFSKRDAARQRLLSAPDFSGYTAPKKKAGKR